MSVAVQPRALVAMAGASGGDIYLQEEGGRSDE